MRNENVLTIPRGTQTVSSMKVAKWIEKEHKNLLRDIDSYIENLSKLGKLKVELSDKINILDYFIEGTYKSGTRNYRYFEVTRKGCEFIANKLIGVKGTQFTAKYIEVFHEMEDRLVNQNNLNIPQEFLDQIPKNYPDALISYAEALRENEVLQEDNRLLESENIKLSSEKEQLLPRAANWETFTNTNYLYTIKEFVALADTGLGRTKMFDFMRKENFILKNVDNENLPYQQYADSGHFKTKMTRRHNGTLYQQLMISPKGMNLVLKRLHDKQMIDSEQLTEMKKLALGLQKNDSAEVSV